MTSSRGSSQPMDQTQVSCSSCIAARFFTTEPLLKPPNYHVTQPSHYWACILITIIEKDTCTPVFFAALFTIAMTWKQPQCPSTDEWIKKMCYIYTTEYYTAIKKNKIMPFAATWIDIESVILNEVSQKRRNIV